MPQADLRTEVRQIEPGDRLTGLSLGAEYTALKIFVQKHAKSFHSLGLAKTYAVFDLDNNNKILAYVTLVCGEIQLENGEHVIPDEEVDYRHKHFPAIKIARLAVDTRHRGLGIGEGLIDLSLGVAKGTVCPAVGCRFIVVDSKQGAINFYKKTGFTMINTEANRERAEPVMFIDLHKI
ncbi:GNAT family N-acetyltransferase [Methylobacterium sp. WL103]|uniref:GNAT family N-acetyltransferase n=1 Tax=Methylobacterium sp. WL103 TaxID=2603891 RepID=UPI0011CBB215|nr:GNAT family N-acetyltransferase [Methylobacterium sp. WL103]TXN03068.1 GNAT family N-acetyltransferase [Methylobacterium sp. WL103]